MTAASPWSAGLIGHGADHEDWLLTPRGAVDRARMRTEVQRLGTELRRHGVGPGSTVALRMPPGLTLLHTMLAAWNADAQVLLIDIRTAPRETDRILDLCEPQFLVTAEPTDGSPAILDVGTAMPTVRRRQTGRPGSGDVVLVQFSSGSTGVPKTIGRTARSLLAELARYRELPGMPGRGDRVVLLNSVIHTMGLVGGILHGLASGAAMVFPRTLRSADIVRAAQDSGAHAVFGVPMHFGLLSRVTPPPLPALRLAVSAGEALPVDVHDRFLERYGIPVSPVYGTTETGLLSAYLTGACAPPEVGLPAPGIESRIVDGELQIRLERSPYLHGGADRFEDGWLRTFDRCERDPVSGRLRLLGRSDSVVAIGGLKADLTEVEAVLRAHPRVDEAVVVYGTVIEAHIGAGNAPNTEELIAWCREHLSEFKVPSRFHIGPALPRNPNGKILRNRDLLHAAYADRGHPCAH